jgi:ectoine hydroxylase-related dioxygenase (phytanoyl-CoA dioxygenase family)
MLARAVNPDSPAQELHVDFRREEAGWPMLGFILMVDEFRSDNGATRFVPGSHKWPAIPDDLITARPADDEGRVVACGPAGSVILYNGSVWHGHAANQTALPRRSIQGAYIRRDAEPWADQAERIRPETFARISPLAKYLLDV